MALEPSRAPLTSWCGPPWPDLRTLDFVMCVPERGLAIVYLKLGWVIWITDTLGQMCVKDFTKSPSSHKIRNYHKRALPQKCNTLQISHILSQPGGFDYCCKTIASASYNWITTIEFTMFARILLFVCLVGFCRCQDICGNENDFAAEMKQLKERMAALEAKNSKMETELNQMKGKEVWKSNLKSDSLARYDRIWN